MEVHVELATRRKMFAGAPNPAHPSNYDAPPNTLVDAVVAALPGALPVMNREAIERSILVGMALGCHIATLSKWDRKNYFYPDLPKGYQISQYDLPLCFDGALEITTDDGPRTVRIIRAHLEEDTGKLGHELPGGGRSDESLIDLNRAGAPLLEIVTHPDLTSGAEAAGFARELRQICRYLGVTEGIMQRGQMRFEPNVNVVIETDDDATRATPIVEVKNLNSFKAIRDAVDYEHRRQVEAWREDLIEDAPGRKSTRGWDEGRQVTLLQRAKEEAHDYRYFPDPDLLPVVIDDAWMAVIEGRMVELPIARRGRYRESLQLSETDALAMTDDRRLADLFEQCLAERPETLDVTDAAMAAMACKLLRNTAARVANERSVEIVDLGISVTQILDLLALRHADTIGSTAADEIFDVLCDTDETAAAAAARLDLLQVRDDAALAAWCDEAISAQPRAADDFRGGKEAALGRLVGEVMKRSRGQADAQAVSEMLRRALGGR